MNISLRKLQKPEEKEKIYTREEALENMKIMIGEGDSNIKNKINICQNDKCNVILYKNYGCNAVICTKCSTKTCIICGFFDKIKNKCNCVRNGITDAYFEERQHEIARKMANMLEFKMTLIE